MLKAREEHVGNVLTDAKRQLGSITRDQQKYAKLLEGLIAQVKLLKAWITKNEWLISLF